MKISVLTYALPTLLELREVRTVGRHVRAGLEHTADAIRLTREIIKRSLDGKRQFAVALNSFTVDEKAGEPAAQLAYEALVYAVACK